MAQKGKKAANGSGTIRKRSDGSWEGRATIGVNPGSGKPIRKSVYAKTKSECAEKLRAITAQIDSGSYLEPSKVTVKGWFTEWFDSYMGDKKPLTVKQYRSMAESHIFPALGAVKLSCLTAPMLTKFYNQLAVDGKTVSCTDRKTGKVTITRKPSSPKTIKNIHGIISKALDDAVDQGLLKSNVAGRAKVPRVEKKEIVPLTEEQQQAFFKAIKDHKYRWLYTTILFTGLRECEAIGLTWDCVDFKHGTLRVYRQLQKRPIAEGGYQFAALKNDKARVIKLSPYMIEVFKTQQAKQIEERFAAGDVWQGWQSDRERKEHFVFTDPLGSHLSVDTVYNQFKRIAKSIDAPAARVHDLRHTFAVNSLQEGDDYKTLQENLGHATASFTLDVYGHVSDKMKEESARRQQGYIQRMGLQSS